MNQAVLHVGLTHDIGRVDSLYGSSPSTESASFHAQSFGFLGRVPRLLFLASLFLTLWLAAPSLAGPDLNEPGERVSLSKHLVADKVNVVFFYARWNKTSMRYKEKLEDWQGDKDTVLHVINVKALNSAVAKQFKLTEVPAFEIYDEEGRLKMKGQSALNEVVRMKMLD